MDPIKARQFSEIICEEPPEIKHTYHVIGNRTHAEGSRVLYTCDDGFRFMNGSVSAYLTCNVTAGWQGIEHHSDSKWTSASQDSVWRD